MTSLAGKPAISLSRVAIYAVLILAVLLYLVPLVVMLLTSFKTPEDISTGNLLSWPTVITGIGWVKAWATVDGYFWNSIKITVPAVLISTAIGALNGYVLSMWRFRGSQLFFGLLLFGCFLPFQTVLLPASFTLGKMGLASTTTGLVFVHIVYGLAFTTLFFRNYYVSIPDALVKAARLDGAGFFTIFRLIILVADHDRATGDVFQAGNAIHQGRFAATRRADQDQELTFLDRQFDVLQGVRQAGTVGLVYVTKFKRCHDYPLTAPAVRPRTKYLPATT